MAQKWRLFTCSYDLAKNVWKIGVWTAAGRLLEVAQCIHSTLHQDRTDTLGGKSWNNFGLGITKLLLQRLMGFKYLSLACFIYILFCKSHKVQDEDSSSRWCDPAWSSLVSRTSAIIARSYRRACHRVPDFVWTLNNFWKFKVAELTSDQSETKAMAALNH